MWGPVIGTPSRASSKMVLLACPRTRKLHVYEGSMTIQQQGVCRVKIRWELLTFRYAVDGLRCSGLFRALQNNESKDVGIAHIPGHDHAPYSSDAK